MLFNKKSGLFAERLLLKKVFKKYSMNLNPKWSKPNLGPLETVFKFSFLNKRFEPID
jgi:hypothetical protein